LGDFASSMCITLIEKGEIIMPDFPYIVFTTQMIIAIPVYILWGMLALWVAKRTKKIPIEQLRHHPRYKIAKLILLFGISVAYTLVFLVTPFLIIGSTIAAYGYNFGDGMLNKMDKAKG
jgi:hypothetical protein